MKPLLLFLTGLFVGTAATAQQSTPEVSVSRSVRQKVNTKSLYIAKEATPSKSQLTDLSAETTISQLQTIQFVQSKAEFVPGTEPALEQLVAFMRDKPTVDIELAGHTDNQGDFDQNVLLSKQRVDLVKAYLVKNGIAAGRIITRGYGPTRPVASNTTEATRRLNRRVEMSVIKQ